jgi:hypothetical protein
VRHVTSESLARTRFSVAGTSEESGPGLRRVGHAWQSKTSNCSVNPSHRKKRSRPAQLSYSFSGNRTPYFLVDSSRRRSGTIMDRSAGCKWRQHLPAPASMARHHWSEHWVDRKSGTCVTGDGRIHSARGSAAARLALVTTMFATRFYIMNAAERSLQHTTVIVGAGTLGGMWEPVGPLDVGLVSTLSTEVRRTMGAIIALRGGSDEDHTDTTRRYIDAQLREEILQVCRSIRDRA